MSPPDAATQARLIEWTGERCVPWTDDVQVVYEHYGRYHFAARTGSGRRVVDVGSGEGYGAAILAASAAEVVGIEIDRASVEHARRTHHTARLGFVEGSVLDPACYGDRPFDVAVCFEVLEHLAEQDELLDTIQGALAEDGLLLISTPDREIYSGPGTTPNPYHVRELSRTEFTDLLGSRFAHVAIWGQWTVAGARMQLVSDGERPGEAGGVALAAEGEGWRLAEVPAPAYLVAAASRRPLPPLPAVWDLHDFGLELVGSARRELEAAHRRIAVLQAEVTRLSAVVPAQSAPPPPPRSVASRALRRGLRELRRRLPSR